MSGASAGSAFLVDVIDDHYNIAPDFFCETFSGDLLLNLHKAMPALFFPSSGT